MVPLFWSSRYPLTHPEPRIVSKTISRLPAYSYTTPQYRTQLPNPTSEPAPATTGEAGSTYQLGPQSATHGARPGTPVHPVVHSGIYCINLGSVRSYAGVCVRLWGVCSVGGSCRVICISSRRDSGAGARGGRAGGSRRLSCGYGTLRYRTNTALYTGRSGNGNGGVSGCRMAGASAR